MSADPVLIDGRVIGGGARCFIIAEAGVNHNGDIALARRLVDVAADAGADAVKFQTFQADALATGSAKKASYQAKATGAEESQQAMLRKLELPLETFRELREHARSRGIAFLSTPFDDESARYLVSIGMSAIKVPSGELTNLPFLARLARFGRPLLISTGMATLSEVEAAMATVRAHGDPPVALFHCVSSYPATPESANLHAMATMRAAFGVPVGYSDHTQGIDIALAATALGAAIIEKHYTTDRSLPGPDHQASLEPEELAAMVRGIRRVESALGHGRKEPTPGELETASVARRSIVAAVDLRSGTQLREKDLALRRPGHGIAPAQLPQLVGRRLREDVPEGTVLTWEMLG